MPIKHRVHMVEFKKGFGGTDWGTTALRAQGTGNCQHGQNGQKHTQDMAFLDPIMLLPEQWQTLSPGLMKTLRTKQIARSVLGSCVYV